MTLSNKQQQELNVLLWFCEESRDVTEADIKKYFDYSDKGIRSDEIRGALGFPKNFSSGFIKLLAAKRNRDLQIESWKEDWGDTINAWSFEDEPQEIAEWISKVLGREMIMVAYHTNKVNEHRRQAYRYQKMVNGKPFNKSLQVRRAQ